MLRGVVVAAVAVSASATQQQLNPIRKVVTMLQSMQKKVQQEGEKEKDLYEKFMCYCKTSGGDLGASISAAEEKIPALGSNIESEEARLAQAKDTLKQAQADRSSAKKATADANALREKEAGIYASVKADADANIAAISKATAAVEKGMGGSFVQTPAASILRRSLPKSGLSDMDQQSLVAFLSQGTGYAPQSGEIVGILKQMGDTMAANLADATSTENDAIKNHGELVSAKKKEVSATTSTVEAKTKQIGELGISIVQMKDDLEDTQASLSEDKKFDSELKKSCSTKTAEWEARSKLRADELVALADTIKVLNDDDALELFKKTLPSASASFVQMTASKVAQRSGALASIRAAKLSALVRDRPGLDLLALALTGKKSAGGFDKVVKMIDNMVDVLHREQTDDDDKKEYCGEQFDSADDKKKGLERTIKQEENAIATVEETIATLTDEIAALTTGIKDLDKSVAEATEQRKEENSEFKALIAGNTAASEVLAFAKNRLNKFYNPKLYKPAPKAELSSEDRIFKNMGNPDDLVTTTALGGIAGTGATVLMQLSSRKDAPAPPPATWDAYAKKGQEINGVIAMVDLLVKDLDKEMTEARTDEKNSQAEYEEMTNDAAEKRTTDSKALTSKSAAKADMEGELQAHKDAKTGAGKELMATMKYIASLHSECDWLVQYYDVRKEARSGEVDSLKKAKAVLSGADYSLVQARSRKFLRRA
jgi:hypothetical protein